MDIDEFSRGAVGHCTGPHDDYTIADCLDHPQTSRSGALQCFHQSYRTSSSNASAFQGYMYHQSYRTSRSNALQRFYRSKENSESLFQPPDELLREPENDENTEHCNSGYDAMNHIHFSSSPAGATNKQYANEDGPLVSCSATRLEEGFRGTRMEAIEHVEEDGDDILPQSRTNGVLLRPNHPTQTHGDSLCKLETKQCLERNSCNIIYLLKFETFF